MAKSRIRIQIEDYSMPDPFYTSKHYGFLYRQLHYGNDFNADSQIEVSQRSLGAVLAATEAYLHFTTHPADTTEQFRTVRRVFNELVNEEGSELLMRRRS